jgi:hypothetical protein
MYLSSTSRARARSRGEIAAAVAPQRLPQGLPTDSPNGQPARPARGQADPRGQHGPTHLQACPRRSRWSGGAGREAARLVCKGGGSQTRLWAIFSQGQICVAAERISDENFGSVELSDLSGCARTCRLWQACHYPGKITKKVIETFDYQGEFVAKGQRDGNVSRPFRNLGSSRANLAPLPMIALLPGRRRLAALHVPVLAPRGPGASD